MPARLVICPVDVVVNKDETIHRTPRVANIPDPGKPPVDSEDNDGNPITIKPTYNFSAMISDGQPGQENDFCLCFVTGVDMSGLDADAEVVSLFDTEDDQTPDGYRAWVEGAPRDLNWSTEKLDRVKSRISAKGGLVSGLERDTSLREFANRIGQRYANSDVLQYISSAKSK